jgi:hypothetical protein
MHYIERLVAQCPDRMRVTLHELDVRDTLGLGEGSSLSNRFGGDVHADNVTLRDEPGKVNGDRSWTTAHVEDSRCGLDVRLQIGTTFRNGARGEDGTHFVIYRHLCRPILSVRDFLGRHVQLENATVRRTDEKNLEM